MAYGRGKSKFSRIAILVSLILHGIAFITFGFVKFYNNEAAGEGKVAVTFIEAQTTKVLRRSLEVRPIASMELSKTQFYWGRSLYYFHTFEKIVGEFLVKYVFA